MKQTESSYRGVLALYLTGLALGGLYVGLVAPVRTVIQLQLGIDDAAGIWIINIYTLFYAALIPVLGRVADLHGRKRVYVWCLVAFAAGSALCGISWLTSGFPVLLAGRFVQAVGACGMIPLAVAEAGTSAPPDKRGTALGITSATSGLSNVLGSAVGSALLALIGNANWGWLFFGCVPVCLALAVLSAVALPKGRSAATGTLDIPGSALFVMAVLALLFAIKGMDFAHLGASFAQTNVWVPLLLALAFIVIFALVEHRSASPMFNASYLTNRALAVTLAVSFFIGCVLISMTLVPEYAEFVLGARVGSGGYYMAILGVFSIVGPIIGGRLIDRIGPKPILMGGLACVVAGYLFLALIVTGSGSMAALLAGLSIVGLGMGFATGAPTNYMILANTSPEDANSAVATATLVRQLGTSIAPAILVGFVTAAPGSQGYTHMMLAVGVAAACAMVVLLAYPAAKR